MDLALIGTKKDRAAAAWRGAIRAKPTMAEAHTMLSLRLAYGNNTKARKDARSHAETALTLAPHLSISYIAMATAITGSDP